MIVPTFFDASPIESVGALSERPLGNPSVKNRRFLTAPLKRGAESLISQKSKIFASFPQGKLFWGVWKSGEPLRQES